MVLDLEQRLLDAEHSRETVRRTCACGSTHGNLASEYQHAQLYTHPLTHSRTQATVCYITLPHAQDHLEHAIYVQEATKQKELQTNQITALTAGHKNASQSLEDATHRIADMEEKEQFLITAAYDATEMAEHYRSDFIQLTTTLAHHTSTLARPA